jgi:hypothetical protein
MTDAAEAGRPGHANRTLHASLRNFLSIVFIRFVFCFWPAARREHRLIGESARIPGQRPQKSHGSAPGIGLSRNGDRVSIDSQTENEPGKGEAK